MDRRLIYLFSLLAFFLMWGLFGFAAATPGSGSAVAATVVPPAGSPLVPGPEENTQLVPVTGDAEQGSGIRVLYVLLAFGALTTILALLNAANKPTTRYARREKPPDES